MTNTVIVVPTIREKQIKEFLDRWKFTVPVLVVEDNPEPTFDIDVAYHYSWQDIDAELGWIIPRRSDCVRSYGYWKAHTLGFEYIITLDDDCYPLNRNMSIPDYTAYFIQQHITNLKPRNTQKWYSTLERPLPRGYPYGETELSQNVLISHGLWQNVLDYDSISQLVFQRYPQETVYRDDFIPVNTYYPMCGMNLAWRREVTPLMYFLLMGQNNAGAYYEYDRFGDIWCGILSKKVIDHLGGAVYSGKPMVWHDRASNVWSNFKKEHKGILTNEELWRAVDSVQLTKTTYKECYIELAEKLPLNDHYWSMTRRAMRVWADLF